MTDPCRISLSFYQFYIVPTTILRTKILWLQSMYRRKLVQQLYSFAWFYLLKTERRNASKSVCGWWRFRTLERLIVILHEFELLRDLYLLEVFVEGVDGDAPR